MADPTDDRGDVGVLRRQRDATRYRILVEVAERQPAVSQREIADAIGVTAQAVSEYVGDLVAAGHVEKLGRGRYEITKEGVDWLISRTEELRSFADHVAEDVVERVEVEAAVATDDVAAGETVTLSMRDGVLHASPDSTGDSGGATAVAIDDAAAGRAVGVTEFEGLLDYEPGAVTILTVPPVPDGADAADPGDVARHAGDADRIAVAGAEGYAVARAADLVPDIQFASPAAVREAAARGLDVVLIAVETEVAPHAERLREGNFGYEVVDLAERDAGR